MARRKKQAELALAEVQTLELDGEVVVGRQLVLPGKVTRTSLELPQGLLFEEYGKIGRALHEISECTMWWIGDWLLFGPKAYGDMYEVPVKATGFKIGTLMNARMVAKRFADFSLRGENLSWHHHKAVVPIKDDALLKRLLGLAEAGTDGKPWSVSALGAVVAAIGEGATLEQALDTVLGIVEDDDDDEDFAGDGSGTVAALRATLGGGLRDFKRNIMAHDPVAVAAQVRGPMKATFRNEVTSTVNWLNRFLAAMEAPPREKAA